MTDIDYDRTDNVISYRNNNGRWEVTYNGRYHGDDRGYSSEADVTAECHKRIATDQRDAVKYRRPPLYVFVAPARASA